MKKKLKNFNYEKLNFFKDREKIGFIVNNSKSLIKIILNKKSKNKKRNKSKNLKNFFL